MALKVYSDDEAVRSNRGQGLVSISAKIEKMLAAACTQQRMPSLSRLLSLVLVSWAFCDVLRYSDLINIRATVFTCMIRRRLQRDPQESGGASAPLSVNAFRPPPPRSVYVYVPPD